MASLYTQLYDYRLTTAQILYHLPDYPELLQSFVWQDLDKAPDFPILKRFLHYWEDHIEGKLHSVTVMHAALIHPGELRYRQGEFALH